MAVFQAYASFYDAFYGDKDYGAECDFVEALCRRFAPGPVTSVLDLGCGTGGHAVPLAQRGYQVTGVDQSAEMLSIAQRKAQSVGQSIQWVQGDVRSLRLQQTFDLALFMFAVLGYQVTNADLTAALRAARQHLSIGGLLIFDVWFGPAVLAERPTDRIKQSQLDDTRVIRLAQPEFDLLAQTVLVNYTILQLAGDRIKQQFSEAHAMRFFFPQELNYFLEQSGFEVRHMCPFLHADDVLTDAVFNLTVVAQAK